MTKVTNSERVDSTISDIHKTRQRISDKFDGNINAILEDARQRQAQSGRRTVSYAKSPNQSVNHKGHPLAGN